MNNSADPVPSWITVAGGILTVDLNSENPVAGDYILDVVAQPLGSNGGELYTTITITVTDTSNQCDIVEPDDPDCDTANVSFNPELQDMVWSVYGGAIT